MKLNYKLVLSIMVITIIALTTSAVANSEADKLAQVDKDEKAMLDMFNKESGNTKSDNNSSKK